MSEKEINENLSTETDSVESIPQEVETQNAPNYQAEIVEILKNIREQIANTNGKEREPSPEQEAIRKEYLSKLEILTEKYAEILSIIKDHKHWFPLGEIESNRIKMPENAFGLIKETRGEVYSMDRSGAARAREIKFLNLRLKKLMDEFLKLDGRFLEDLGIKSMENLYSDYDWGDNRFYINYGYSTVDTI